MPRRLLVLRLPDPATDPAWRRGLAAGCLLLAGWSMGTPAWDPAAIERAAARHGPGAVRSVEALERAVERVRRRGELAQADAVNAFYNFRLQYRDDLEAWGEADHWSSPLESLARGVGDCEDFALAKYFTLVALGVPERRLRLVYARLAPDGEGAAVRTHMVLAYFPQPDEPPLVLDNLTAELRPIGQRTDLWPVFSFNAHGLWEGLGPDAIGGPGPTDRLARWRAVLAQARQDGFSAQ
jgi:predicted transglutaminase-like cysteine proteinase